MRRVHLTSALLTLAALTACNDIPEGAVVGIQPELATTNDDLTAVLLTEATDKQPLTYRYAWYLGGELVEDLTSDVVPAARTAKGEDWTVVVTPNDGKVDGIVAEASITIGNAAPTATVAISPTAPTTVEDLVATAEGFDDDGDSVTLDWEWARDGVVVQGDRNTVPSRETQKGEVWEVTVTPTDGELEGEPVSASVTIVNERPVAESVSLSPLEVYADTTLTAAAVGSDPDEDPLSWSYTFYVGGGEVSSGPGDTLAGAFAKGDSVFVEAVANDGSSDSEPVQSDPVVVLNTPPTLTGARIDPADPKGDAVLSCLPEGEADIDADTVTSTHIWIVNGRVVADGGTLDNASFRKGDLVQCRVTPNDGEADGTPVESTGVEIGNTPPSIASIAITPDPAGTGDTLGVNIVGASDRDGDAITTRYAWTIAGGGVGTDSTLDASAHSRGDVVVVEVIPNDGEDDGAPVTATLTISNTVPTAPTVAMDPIRPLPADDIVCEISAASVDADGDSVRYSFAWTRNGTAWTGSTSGTTYGGDTISSSNTVDKDVWACTVTPSDGTGSGPAGSATATVSKRDGQVRTVAGTWLDVRYVQCGTGASCSGTQAKKACTDEGMKLVSHASNGTSSVQSLGATASCQWSSGYFTTERTRASGECLVGVSNMDWSSCCGVGSWHGNTLKFGAVSTVFGHINASNSGYVSSYTNTSGVKWSCRTESSNATNNSCTSMYVACAL